MPKKQNSVGITTHESGAVNHVGMAVNDGLKQRHVLVGVVLEVSVLNNHVVAGGHSDAGVQCGALALVDLVLAVGEGQ